LSGRSMTAWPNVGFRRERFIHITIVLFWQDQSYRQPPSKLKQRPETMAATSKSKGFAWPNNAPLAVAVTCLLASWSGDKGPPFSVQTTALKPGTHDRAAMTWGTYGVRAGVCG